MRTVKSFGIVLVNPDTNSVCLVQRKDSFGYLTCIVENDQLANGSRDVTETLATITQSEKQKLLNWSWDQLWNDCNSNSTRKQECQARFDWLGIRDAVKILDERGEKWCDDATSHWGLPKGRMSPTDNGTSMRCAMRELQEETGIPSTHYSIVSATDQLIDRVIGTNGTLYVTEYFVCRLAQVKTASKQKACKEIRAIAWMTLDEAKAVLRPSTYDIVVAAINRTQQKR